MTTSAQAYREERFAVAGTELYLLKGGEGRPLLVLHGVEGHEGWLPFHDAVSPGAEVYAPSSDLGAAAGSQHRWPSCAPGICGVSCWSTPRG